MWSYHPSLNREKEEWRWPSPHALKGE
jgi:hypothetical protein